MERKDIEAEALVISQKSGIKRFILFVAGILCTIFGLLGMVLPVLPTTPFLLLAAICFVQSSSKAYYWLLTNRIFGKFIQDYRKGKGISKRHKLIVITFLWGTIFVSILLISVVWLRILLLIIALSVSTHILLIKPKPST